MPRSFRPSVDDCGNRGSCAVGSRITGIGSHGDSDQYANPSAHEDTGADQNAHVHANPDIDRDAHQNDHTGGDSHLVTNADGHCDVHSYRNRHPDARGDFDGHPNRHSDSNTNRDAGANIDADRATDGVGILSRRWRLIDDKGGQPDRCSTIHHSHGNAAFRPMYGQ